MFRRLLGASDVLVENFVPGALARSSGSTMPRRVAAPPAARPLQHHGLRPRRTYADRSSLDLVRAGGVGADGEDRLPEAPPTKVGATVGDQVPAIYAALGVVAALRQRDRDGRGQKVDVAMLDALVLAALGRAARRVRAPEVPERVGSTDPRGAPLDAFRTADGWAAVVVTSQPSGAHVRGDRAAPSSSVRYANARGSRARPRPPVNDAVAQWCAAARPDEVVARFLAIEVRGGSGARRVRRAGRSAGADTAVRWCRCCTPTARSPPGYVGARVPRSPLRADTRTAPAEYARREHARRAARAARLGDTGARRAAGRARVRITHGPRRKPRPSEECARRLIAAILRRRRRGATERLYH